MDSTSGISVAAGGSGILGLVQVALQKQTMEMAQANMQKLTSSLPQQAPVSEPGKGQNLDIRI